MDELVKKYDSVIVKNVLPSEKSRISEIVNKFRAFYFTNRIDKVKICLIESGKIEMGYPFTLEDEIILPRDKISEEIIYHESIHIS